MHPRSVFSHVTAAKLYGLPVLPGDDADLHVTTIHPVRAPKGRGIIGHAVVGERERCDLRGLPVPTPVEVWVQLASVSSADDLVIVGDALTRRKAPLADTDQLAAAVAEATGRPGITRLRDALPRVRPRTDSPMETVLRLAIVRGGLPEPHVNYGIHGRAGRIVAHGDLVFPSQRVVVEYDGDQHRTSEEQYRIDIDRLWRIESLGWRVIRINRTHMRDNAREALYRIRRALTVGPNTPS
jgi:very-short-patch-repair endonuclease